MLADAIEASLQGACIISILQDKQKKCLVCNLQSVLDETIILIFHAGVVQQAPSTYRMFDRMPTRHAARCITWWDEPLPNKINFALASGDMLVIQASSIEIRL